MRIASGVADQYIYFVAVDDEDFVTRVTGLSSFTVYRSRNGGTATAMTTPTVSEVSSSNMPGVYRLLLDEDMTIDSGDETQEMAFHITASGMAPVTRTIELYRPKITIGNTLDVTATGAAGVDWGNVENPTTAVDLSSTTVKTATDIETMIGAPESSLAELLGGIDDNVADVLAVAEKLDDTMENDGGTYRFTSAALAAHLTTTIETGITLFQHYRYSAAVLYGEASGMEAGETVFLDPAGEVERVTVQRSEDDRTSVTLDSSDPE